VCSDVRHSDKYIRVAEARLGRFTFRTVNTKMMFPGQHHYDVTQAPKTVAPAPLRKADVLNGKIMPERRIRSTLWPSVAANSLPPSPNHVKSGRLFGYPAVRFPSIRDARVVRAYTYIYVPYVSVGPRIRRSFDGDGASDLAAFVACFRLLRSRARSSFIHAKKAGARRIREAIPVSV